MELPRGQRMHRHNRVPNSGAAEQKRKTPSRESQTGLPYEPKKRKHTAGPNVNQAIKRSDLAKKLEELSKEYTTIEFQFNTKRDRESFNSYCIETYKTAAQQGGFLINTQHPFSIFFNKTGLASICAQCFPEYSKCDDEASYKEAISPLVSAVPTPSVEFTIESLNQAIQSLSLQRLPGLKIHFDRVVDMHTFNEECKKAYPYLVDFDFLTQYGQFGFYYDFFEQSILNVTKEGLETIKEKISDSGELSFGQTLVRKDNGEIHIYVKELKR